MYDVWRDHGQEFLFLLSRLSTPSVFIYIQARNQFLTCSVD